MPISGYVLHSTLLVQLIELYYEYPWISHSLQSSTLKVQSHIDLIWFHCLSQMRNWINNIKQSWVLGSIGLIYRANRTRNVEDDHCRTQNVNLLVFVLGQIV